MLPSTQEKGLIGLYGKMAITVVMDGVVSPNVLKFQLLTSSVNISSSVDWVPPWVIGKTLCGEMVHGRILVLNQEPHPSGIKECGV